MISIVELVRIFADPLDTAVVVTDCLLKAPGPTILYINPAFIRMSGYDVQDLVGQSPRLLQGPQTDRRATYALSRRLRMEGQSRGILRNYRKSGEAYFCELDIRRIIGNDGVPHGYIAFEREVVRRRGRPAKDGMGSYSPVDAAIITPSGIFE